MTAVTEALRMYRWSAIQNTGSFPSSTSRMVPPPNAVTSASTSTPKRSTCLPRAACTPVMAAMLTPICSRIYCINNPFRPCPAVARLQSYWKIAVARQSRSAVSRTQ